MNSNLDLGWEEWVSLPSINLPYIKAKAIGLSVAGVDILRSKRGPLVLEVNSSPGIQGIEKTLEIDIAGQIIMFCEKKLGIFF